MDEKSCIVLTARDIQQMGFSRPMTYQLLNREDLPVVEIGGRKFMHKALFLQWLEAQATNSGEKGA